MKDYRDTVEHPCPTTDIETWDKVPQVLDASNPEVGPIIRDVSPADNLHIESTGGLFIGPPKKIRCPVCGEEYAEQEGLCVTIPPYTGTYCLKCWAKWISENIPKCEAIK